MSGLDIFLDAFFNQKVIDKYLPDILWGMVVTVQAGLAVVVTGILAGLLLAAVRSFHIRPLNWLIVGFVDIFRALPPLVIILIVYFGLPNVGISLPSFAVLWLVLSLVLAAFAEEIFWAGIASIRKGQWEAARSTGLSAPQTLVHVVIPQAVRNVLPDLVSNTVEVVKLTSTASVVALPELLYAADMARSVTYNPSSLVLAAAIYLALLWPCVRLLSRLEHRAGR